MERQGGDRTEARGGPVGEKKAGVREWFRGMIAQKEKERK
jgi:hypothetical protein